MSRHTYRIAMVSTIVLMIVGEVVFERDTTSLTAAMIVITYVEQRFGSNHT